ncbi:unnamed protein product [Cunninghamella echinulata]
MTIDNKISVLFVCLGNICRSPMSEAVFAHTVKANQLNYHFQKIDSAGTAGYHVGEKPILVVYPLVISRHFDEFDYILCMDESNLEDLMDKKPAGSKAVVKLFGDFDPQGDRIIRDPYYGGIDGFEHNFQQNCAE